MLQIGNVGLTVDEQYSHMALWCVAGAPLLAGTDLIHADNQTLSILTNPEVIAVDQDHGGNNAVQGRLIRNTSSFEIWGKRLSDGNWAVILLNILNSNISSIAVTWADLGL